MCTRMCINMLCESQWVVHVYRQFGSVCVQVCGFFIFWLFGSYYSLATKWQLFSPEVKMEEFESCTLWLTINSPHKHTRYRTLTSHSPMASWFFSCISQSSWTLSAQWWMVRITGLVSRAPGGPQLTTGLSTVWMSSTGGLEKIENTEVKWFFSRRAALLATC